MRRVVITGMGCISSLGHDLESFSKGVLQGVCGIGPITLCDVEDLRVEVAAEVTAYDEAAHFQRQQLSRLDRVTQFGMLSAREATRDAGLTFDGELSDRTVVVHGTGAGGQNTQDESGRRVYGEKAKRLHPFTVPKAMSSAATCQISIDLGVRGPAFSTTSGCASSGHAIAMSVMMLRAGMADVAITGGSEACITPVMLRGWQGMGVLARDTCRPFSARRGGMVLGEGAATLILETLDHARERGARIYAELVGVGMTSDAYNLVQPSAEGITRSLLAATSFIWRTCLV